MVSLSWTVRQPSYSVKYLNRYFICALCSCAGIGLKSKRPKIFYRGINYGPLRSSPISIKVKWLTISKIIDLIMDESRKLVKATDLVKIVGQYWKGNRVETIVWWKQFLTPEWMPQHFDKLKWYEVKRNFDCR